ncbi:acyltransferase [Glaciecola sp. KUL10]|uniref:acyltransferase n=1 Tax=Glaciecola sp. (strain KUL10) TaxID=2161813 RepID=UPI000D7843B8|nr:acyltransferase [Glaciecola sp. KUL10]
MSKIKSCITFFVHFCLQMTNLGFWGICIVLFGLVRFALPFQVVQNLLLGLMHRFYFTFSVISVWLIKRFNQLDINISINSELSKEKWYLIIANHLSYLDIILLIEFCAKHTSPPKFFLKKELIWMPFVGVAAWALDMPFMRRYSQAVIQKHPHLKGKDIEATRKSCEKFVDQPTSVINFVEGTRYTPSKALARKSPFKHLMRPKAGGIAFTMASMGEQFSNVLDVTLCYPDSEHPMNDMLCGNMTRINIDVKVLSMSDDMIGDYFEDENFKTTFQSWLNQVWLNKDELIKQWIKA